MSRNDTIRAQSGFREEEITNLVFLFNELISEMSGNLCRQDKLSFIQEKNEGLYTWKLLESPSRETKCNASLIFLPYQRSCPLKNVEISFGAI